MQPNSPTPIPATPNPAQSPTPNPTPLNQPSSGASRPESGKPGDQAYSKPLVISNSLTRFFVGLAVVCVVLSLALFILKQLGRPSEDVTLVLSGSAYDTILLVLSRINNVAVFARIACLGFAVAATIIRVLNPHPYNTKTLIVAWVSAILTFVALIVFR